MSENCSWLIKVAFYAVSMFRVNSFEVKKLLIDIFLNFDDFEQVFAYRAERSQW